MCTIIIHGMELIFMGPVNLVRASSNSESVIDLISQVCNLTHIMSIFSGISSVVRRCIDKETGKEYAAKIIDLGGSESNDCNQMLEATRQEISILRQVMGHPYLSESIL